MFSNNKHQIPTVQVIVDQRCKLRNTTLPIVGIMISFSEVLFQNAVVRKSTFCPLGLAFIHMFNWRSSIYNSRFPIIDAHDTIIGIKPQFISIIS